MLEKHSDATAKARAERLRVAIACQGGGSHAAYAAGVLKGLLAKIRSIGPETGYRVMGLSGTSGGAVCALLAWCGMLGTSRLSGGHLQFGSADELLDAFWQDNGAASVSERLVNSATLLAARAPVEVRLSPYELPFRLLMEQVRWWSARPEFTDLRRLLEKHIDVALLEPIMRIFQLEQAIRNARKPQRLTSIDALDDFAGRPLDPVAVEPFKQQLAELGKQLDEFPEGRFVGVIDLFRQANAQAQQSTDAEALLAALQSFAREIPVLLIGAVDVARGKFTAFSSARGEIRVEVVLASAALPWIFEAVPVPPVDGADEDDDELGFYYWDGLFSQNPPISNFLTDPDTVEAKPHEIWVVQINPQSSPEEPKTVAAIMDRRNELSGNLSLNQEAGAIQTVSRWARKGLLDPEQYQPVEVFRIQMDSIGLEAKLGPLGAESKLDRAPEFLNALSVHGEAQAELFWQVRRFVTGVLNERDPTKRRAALTELVEADLRGKLEAEIGAYRNVFPELHLYIETLELTQRGESDADSGRATVRWRTRATHAATGSPMDLRGKATFALHDGLIREARLIDAEVTKVQAPVPPAPQQQPLKTAGLEK